MKTNNSTPSHRSGFTLIEMIGVLAIIAVLAALLVPRIFSAINDSRINSAATSYNSLKSAAMSYFGKFGRFGDETGAAVTDFTSTDATSWDNNVLLAAGFLEKPFNTKIADSHVVRMVAPTGTDLLAAATRNYDLDGNASIDTASAVAIIEAALTNVALDDARALSATIDGATLSTTTGGDDTEGRVRYAFDTATSGTVYLYIAHK
jgi:prepilin-type N-terminal cleavage/methylation domain-containing protein